MSLHHVSEYVGKTAETSTIQQTDHIPHRVQGDPMSRFNAEPRSLLPVQLHRQQLVHLSNHLPLRMVTNADDPFPTQ